MPQPTLVRLMHRCRMCGYHFTKEFGAEPTQCPWDGAEFVVDSKYHPEVKSSRPYVEPTQAERAAWDRWRESQAETAPAPTNGNHHETAEEVAVDTDELAVAAGG